MSKNNSGSTTVEMCFVMPIVFSVIVICLSILLGSVTDIRAQEMAYSAIYTYSGINDFYKGTEYAQNNALENKPDKANGQLTVYEKNGNLYGYATNIEGILGIRNKEITYSTEYDRCTERLRRWQLYGDIFQE